MRPSLDPTPRQIVALSGLAGAGLVGVRLVTVLGHTQCGAVKAALKRIDARDALPGAIEDLVTAIRPAVARARGQADDALESVSSANVGVRVERPRALEPILAGPVKEGQLKLVGGVYDLRSGGAMVIA
jgi:carbonic anhydrase